MRYRKKSDRGLLFTQELLKEVNEKTIKVSNQEVLCAIIYTGSHIEENIKTGRHS